MSTIIKKGEQGALLQRLVTFDLADHMTEARKIVSEAQARARQIVGEARVESRRLREQAQAQGRQAGYDAGYAEGLAAGQEQGRAEAGQRFEREHAALAAAMEAVIGAVERRKEDLLIEAGRDVLEFAVTLARKVTHGVARLDRQAAVGNVEQALRLAGDRTDLTVRVSPQDADTLRRFAEDLAGRIGKAEHVTVVADESISPGGAVVTAGGPGGSEVDATIETQLEQLTWLLLGDSAAGGTVGRRAAQGEGGGGPETASGATQPEAGHDTEP